jgi:hypothetical protein
MLLPLSHTCCGLIYIVWSYLSFWDCPKPVLDFTIILISFIATELRGNMHSRPPLVLYMVSLAMVSVTQSQQWSDHCGKFQNQTTHMFQITFITLFCYNCSFLLFIIVVNFFLCLIYKLNFMRGMYCIRKNIMYSISTVGLPLGFLEYIFHGQGENAVCKFYFLLYLN